MISNIQVAVVMQEIVNDVKEQVLPVLQAYNPAIVNINYLYGTNDEMRTKLAAMSRTPDEKAKMYPCIMLLDEITITESKGKYPGVIKMQLAIVYPAKKDATSQVNYTTIFPNILQPVYNQLLISIADSGYFVLYSEKDVIHKRGELQNMKMSAQQATFDTVNYIVMADITLTILNENKFLKPINESIEGI